MICPNCQTANEAGRKFCKECGAGLALSCPNCGAANTSDAKFCGECGTTLAGLASAAASAARGIAAPPAEQAIPVAERRLVSVLFADLVGFTTLAEGRDPEETRDLLSRYFALAREVIERAGGTVEKFIGDAVMAVWGAPVARENDAELAVRAALELVGAVRTLGPSIQARAGVLTGEAAVTVGAVGEGMVAGDLVNTASRLQSVAPPGTVLVGESTERAASQAIAFEPAGPQLLKGKETPVSAFRALRVVAESGGRNRAETLEAPFVGRDDELRLLKDLFTATARDKRPRLVSVMGPAGIGKSRLAWEFLKYLDGLVEDTYWHIGRSPSYGEGITFWALGEMIRRRAGLLETDDDETTRAKLADTVARWVADEGERRWVETALLALLGLGEPLPGGRDELFAAWRTFFERIAEHGTTVLTFEDLQWADAGLLDFIDHVLEWTKSLPLFVITLARPELLERRPQWGAGRRDFVSLGLDPLPEPAMRQLLSGLVPGLPDGTADAIVARADGIPLYAVETVRMLVAEGRLTQEDGVYRPTGDLKTLAIPETLAALIAARLDGLEPAERGLLQDAAVLGQSFTLTGLAAVSGRETEAVEVVLRALVRREVLVLNVDPRSPERGQYGFVQALIREVAYNQLAKAERKSRHLAAARWLESLGDETLAGALAGQYADAHRNAPAGPEAEALSAQARLALKGAAERASALGSHEQAVSFLQRALEITSDAPERALLLLRAGQAALDGGAQGLARPFLDEALAIFRSQGDALGEARAATTLSLLLHEKLSPADAIPILEAALAQAQGLEEEPDVVRLLAELARAYANTRHPMALETADRVLALAEPLGDMQIIAEALINRALVLVYAGRFHEPNAILRGVIPMTETHGLVRAQTRAMNNLASILGDDDPRAGYELAERAAEVSRRAGAKGWLAYFELAMAEFGLMLGRLDETERLLDGSVDAYARSGTDFEHHAIRARLLSLRGEDAAAAAELDAMAPLVAGITHYDTKASWWLLQAQVMGVAGRLDEAYRHATQGMAIGESSIVPYSAWWAAHMAFWSRDPEKAARAVEVFRSERGQGRVLDALGRELEAGMDALAGETADALAAYREAIRMWRDLGTPLYLGDTLLDLVTLVPPSNADAAAAAQEARDLFMRLGSVALLARLDAALAGWATPGQATSAGAAEPQKGPVTPAGATQ